MPAPKIDPRSYEQIVAQAEALAAHYTQGRWGAAGAEEVAATPEALAGRVLAQELGDPARAGGPPLAAPGALLDAALALRISGALAGGKVSVRRHPERRADDLGAALIRIFGRYAELILQRLNQVPEKHFLAFLSLIGIDLRPPLPARVPLTFTLVEGSPVEALVPAGTQIAAPPLSGDEDEVIFETERDLVVSSASLVAAYTRDFAPDFAPGGPGTPLRDMDRYADVTAQALGAVGAPFLAFAGDRPVEHTLFIASGALLTLPEPTDVTIQISSPEARRLSALPLAWAYLKEGRWHPIAPSVGAGVAGDLWAPALKGVPRLTRETVNGVEGGWLRARLAIPLPPARAGIAPDGVASGVERAVAPTLPYRLFGAAGVTTWHLSCLDGFGRAGSTVTLEVRLADPPPAPQGAGVRLRWEYKRPGADTDADDDGGPWVPLGESGSDGAATGDGFADETRALTRPGVVRLHVPPDGSWGRSRHGGRTGRWLRVTLAEGGYGEPPRIADASVSFAWELPAVSQIAVALPATSPALAPERAFANSVAVDLSKAFQPFGPEPRPQDTFYVALDPALGPGGAAPGDAVEIGLKLAPPGVAGGDPARGDDMATEARAAGLTLAWELYDGQRWRPLTREADGFEDGTASLTAAQTVRFTLPTWQAPTTVNGEQGCWLRVRIAGGGYGIGPGYIPRKVTLSGVELTVYDLAPASFRPPTVESITLTARRGSGRAPDTCLSYNDFAYADHTGAAGPGESSFQPFEPTADVDPALYLGFDRRFANRTVSLYVHVEQPEPEAVSYGALAGPPASPPSVAWEYAGPMGWAPLGALDETRALAQSGTLRFIGPPDLAERALFGRRLFWVRARRRGGAFPLPPRLRRVLPNTTWAVQAATYRGEKLGSGSGEPGQTLRSAQAPVLAGPTLEVREAELPPPAEHIALVREEGPDAVRVVPAVAGAPEEIWVRWRQVPDFHSSGPRDRHYTLDHETGTFRFGDGLRGMVPPPGQNNIVVARYQVGGGLRGNRAPGSVAELKTSVPYVDRVTNLEAATGGGEREPIAGAQRYGPRQLRHRGRAITAEDYEDLAYAASPEVARARAVPAALVRGVSPAQLWLAPARGEQGHPPDTTLHRQVGGAGAVGVVIVPQGDSPRPTPSLGLIDQVRGYLQQRAGPTVDLWVAGPDWVRVTVAVEVVPRSYEDGDRARAEVGAALQRFLHPLTGGPEGKGWAFGRRPHESDLYALLARLPGVDHIRALQVSLEPRIGAIAPERRGAFLVYSGDHRVTLALPGGGD